MKILITGDRNWTDRATMRRVLEKFDTTFKNFDIDQIKFIHGGASGADSMGGLIARELGWNVTIYPADWKKYGRGAGPIRNGLMLDEEPDFVIAFHNDLENSKGTKHCVTEARKRGLFVLHFTSDTP
jgi:hypothetical protein